METPTFTLKENTMPRVWQKSDQKHRPACPTKKRDSAILSSSFSNDCHITTLAIDSVQRSPQICPQQRLPVSPPDIAKVSV